MFTICDSLDTKYSDDIEAVASACYRLVAFAMLYKAIRITRRPDPAFNRGVGAIAGLLLSALLITAGPAAATPTLHVDNRTPKAGYFQLSWSPAATGTRYQLEQSTSPDFSKTLDWQIDDRHRFSMSGLPNGNYWYRLRVDGDPPGQWSEPVEVHVQHQSLARAFSFFGAGFVVFVTLVGVVVLRPGQVDD